VRLIKNLCIRKNTDSRKNFLCGFIFTFDITGRFAVPISCTGQINVVR